jgi:hypothetical protein
MRERRRSRSPRRESPRREPKGENGGMGERETGDRNATLPSPALPDRAGKKEVEHKLGGSEVQSKETLNGDDSREKSEQAARRKGRGRGESDSPESGERELGTDTVNEKKKGGKTDSE